MSAYVITVAQQKGGSGKTTLAINLAAAFAKRRYSTMLFDTDPQGTSRQWHAKRKSDDIGLVATSGWRLTKDLSMARDSNDVIIIDSPPHAEMDAKVSIRAADLVVLPLQPSPADLWAVQDTVRMIEAERKQCMVVLNRVVPRAGITKDIKDKLMLMDIPVAKTTIGSRVVFAKTMKDGQTVMDEGKSSSFTELDNLTGEIMEMIGMSNARGSMPKLKKAS